MSRHTGAELRAKIHTPGERVYGCNCTSTNPKFPEALASSGIDLVFIDTEHTPIPRDTLAWMARLFNACGVPAVSRVPEPEPYKVCEYLDAGCQGVVAPYMETIKEVKDLVGATKLRPLKGEKLKKILDALTPVEAGDGARTNEILYDQVDKILGETVTSTFMKKKNKNILTFLNIESVGAVNRLEELLAIPGVDGVFVGPHDLSCNYGVAEQWESDTFLNAIDAIIDACKKFSMGCAIHYSFIHSLEYQAKWSKRGANIILHSSDDKLACEKLREDLAEIQKLSGDANNRKRKLEEVEAV